MLIFLQQFKRLYVIVIGLYVIVIGLYVIVIGLYVIVIGLYVIVIGLIDCFSSFSPLLCKIYFVFFVKVNLTYTLF
jgi:hypothetical protein